MACLDVRDGERVLDIGCGTGTVTVKVLAMAPRAVITAVDKAGGMISAAKQNYGQTSAKFIKADFIKTDYANEYDVVFSNSVFHWFSHQGVAFAKVLGALKRGGRFGVQVPADGFCPLLFTDVLDSLRAGSSWRQYFHRFKLPWRFPSQAEYQDILQRTGFKEFDVFTKVYAAGFADLSGVVDYMQAAGLQPYLARLPETMRESFIQAFQNLLADALKVASARQRIELTFLRLFAFGKK